MDKNRCYICGDINSYKKNIEKQALLREERCVCCNGSRRNNVVAYALLKVLKLEHMFLKEAVEEINKLKVSIFEAASTGVISNILRDVNLYECSEYFPNVAEGDHFDGIRCENLERLTFESNKFDIVIDQDVLEHVYDYQKALSEIHRILKSDGVHIFTIPFNNLYKTQLRFNPDGSSVLPVVFHGDSIRKDGIAVTVDFGNNLIEDLSKIGFETEELIMDKWHDEGDVTWIGSSDEYKNYLKLKHDPLMYFKYNNQVFISKKMSKNDINNNKLKFTGERMMPEFNMGSEIYLEHMSRYIFASQFVENKIVLDIACGSGYGSEYLLKNGAKKVIGIDISKDAIKYCKKMYRKGGLEFIIGNANKIPLEDNSIDVVVSFETLEHMEENSQNVFMAEIKRVLTNDGVLIMSTPNKKVFPDKNPFHLHELSKKEFVNFFDSNFKYARLFFQDDLELSLINDSEKIEFEKINVKQLDLLDLESSMYFLAVCSDVELIKAQSHLFISGIQSWRNTIDLQRLKEEKYPQRIDNLNNKILELEKELRFIKSSKFWRIRNLYVKIFKK